LGESKFQIFETIAGKLGFFFSSWKIFSSDWNANKILQFCIKPFFLYYYYYYYYQPGSFWNKNRNNGKKEKVSKSTILSNQKCEEKNKQEIVNFSS